MAIKLTEEQVRNLTNPEVVFSYGDTLKGIKLGKFQKKKMELTSCQ